MTAKPTVSRTCYRCDNCNKNWNEKAVLQNKLYQLKTTEPGGGWTTTAALKQFILKEGFPSVQDWWNKFGKAEKICPYAGAYCCKQDGWTWAI